MPECVAVSGGSGHAPGRGRCRGRNAWNSGLRGAESCDYHGWPLYYFTRDEDADAPQGQDVESFGGEWYLITPDGEKVHAG